MNCIFRHHRPKFRVGMRSPIGNPSVGHGQRPPLFRHCKGRAVKGTEAVAFFCEANWKFMLTRLSSMLRIERKMKTLIFSPYLEQDILCLGPLPELGQAMDALIEILAQDSSISGHFQNDQGWRSRPVRVIDLRTKFRQHDVAVQVPIIESEDSVELLRLIVVALPHEVAS